MPVMPPGTQPTFSSGTHKNLYDQAQQTSFCSSCHSSFQLRYSSIIRQQCSDTPPLHTARPSQSSDLINFLILSAIPLIELATGTFLNICAGVGAVYPPVSPMPFPSAAESSFLFDVYRWISSRVERYPSVILAFLLFCFQLFFQLIKFFDIIHAFNCFIRWLLYQDVPDKVPVPFHCRIFSLENVIRFPHRSNIITFQFLQ